MPYHQFTIRLPESLHQPLILRLNDIGCLGVVEGEGSLTAFFPLSVDRRVIETELSILSALFDRSGVSASLSVEHIVLADQDWNIDWKKNFPPIDIGQRFSIRPPWNSAAEGRIALIIDPGMAFGTGHHETTKSCLLLMERLAGTVDRDRFLDLGTGTGLLAIAALKLGFRSVEAIDTDPLAIEAAGSNLRLNDAPSIVLFEGGIERTTGQYDMIAANLISGTLISLSRELAARLRPQGIAILSGILKGQEPEVIQAMQEAGLVLFESLQDGKWMTLAVRP